MRTIYFFFLVVLTLNIHANSNHLISSDNVNYSTHIKGGYIHVNLSTSDANTMALMLRRGFSIYFDKKGKKKKHTFITYPILEDQPQQQQRRRPQGSQQGRQGFSFVEFINSMPREALFTQGEKIQKFNLDLNNLDISITYNHSKNDQGINKLDYLLKIPLSKIADKNENLDKLSIGVISNSINSNARPTNNNRNNSFSSGQGRGGRGGRNRGQDGFPNRRNQGQDRQQIELNHWFHLNEV